MTRSWMVAALGAAAWTGCGGDDGDESCSGRPILTCPPAVEVACTGVTTPVILARPQVCGDVEVTGEVPAQFVVGQTTVQLMARGRAGEATCRTTVTVVDDVPPALACPPDQVVVRAAPGETASAPQATATDACSNEVQVTASQDFLRPGSNVITYRARDPAGNEAECSTSVALVDAFAVAGLRLVDARLSSDGATTAVTLAWDRTGAAAVSGYRVERASAEAGPYEPLATVGVDTLLYTDELPASRAWYRVVTLVDEAEGGVTAPALARAIARDGYDLRGQPVEGVPFDTTLYGTVRYPVDLSDGPFPLVVMLHGNHGICRETADGAEDFCATSEDHECPTGDLTTPNAEGYEYLLETLAAQGYVAASISGNAMNCREGFILERAALLVEHLRRWAQWSAGAGGPFGARFVGALDLARVALVGHSRGGDAVANVPGLLAAAPIDGLAVASVLSIAPTDFHDVAVAATPYAVLLPACDGDVFDLVGMDIYDRSIRLTDGAPRAQVLFVGANHNFFNTEWKLSDNGREYACQRAVEVGNQAQMGMLSGTLGAWLKGTLRGEALEAFVRAEADTPTGIDAWAGVDLDLRWSYAAPARALIDDFEGDGAPEVNALGGANQFTGWRDETERCQQTQCGSRFLHAKNGMKLLWDGGEVPIAALDLAGLDASGYAALSFRVVSRRSTLNTGLEAHDFWLRLYDADGRVAELLLSELKRVRHLYPRAFAREVLETVRVPLDELVALAPELDLTRLAAFELEMSALERSGSVVVTDFEVAVE